MREPIYSQSPFWTAEWRSNLQAGFAREPTAETPGAMNKPPPSLDIEGSLQSHADVLQDSWLKYSRPRFSNVAICLSPAQTREEKYVLFHMKSECTAHNWSFLVRASTMLCWTELGKLISCEAQTELDLSLGTVSDYLRQWIFQPIPSNWAKEGDLGCRWLSCNSKLPLTISEDILMKLIRESEFWWCLDGRLTGKPMEPSWSANLENKQDIL